MALVAIGDESITVAASAIGFTSTEISDEVVMATVNLEDAAVRFNPSQDPTAGGSEGSPTIEPGDEPLEVWGHPDLNGIRFIRRDSVSGILRVLFYGTGKT